MTSASTGTAAVLGTGTMGAGMARSLLKAGLAVRAWNRTAEKAAPLADDGALVFDSPAEAVTDADVVVVMLYDADSVVDVLGQISDALGEAAVVLQCSTVGLDIARVVDAAEQHGVRLVDAPVLGTRAPAESGALTVLAAGDPTLREAVQPVLDAVGSRTLWVADSPGAASALKLVCNAWVASVNAATGQSVALARGLGLDPALFLDAIDGTAVDTPYAHVKGEAMIARGRGDADQTVSFALDGVRKDLGLIAAAAGEASVSATLVTALREVYDAASTDGHGAEDMAAVVEAFGA